MLFIFFLFSLSLTFAIPSLLPQINLTFFAPFLIYAYYKKPILFCLWISLVCGLILDLLGAQQRLGLYALNYCITTSMLYKQKANFFEDSLSTIPILTLLFSVISTGIQILLLYVFEKGIPFSWELVWTDFMMMPLLDAFYGFLSFTIPLFCLSKGSRSGEEYFMNRASRVAQK